MIEKSLEFLRFKGFTATSMNRAFKLDRTTSDFEAGLLSAVANEVISSQYQSRK